MKFFTKAEESKYQDQFIESMSRELYNLNREIAYSVQLILEKENEVAKIDETLLKLEAKLPKDPIKASKMLYDKHKVLKHEIAGFEFMRNGLKNALKKLYDEVSVKGNQTKAIEKNIVFVRGLDLEKVPQLPFLEVNGTRYKAENNRPVYDEHNVMILYVEKHTPQESKKI